MPLRKAKYPRGRRNAREGARPGSRGRKATHKTSGSLHLLRQSSSSRSSSSRISRIASLNIRTSVSSSDRLEGRCTGVMAPWTTGPCHHEDSAPLAHGRWTGMCQRCSAFYTQTENRAPKRGPGQSRTQPFCPITLPSTRRPDRKSPSAALAGTLKTSDDPTDFVSGLMLHTSLRTRTGKCRTPAHLLPFCSRMCSLLLSTEECLGSTNASSVSRIRGSSRRSFPCSLLI